MRRPVAFVLLATVLVVLSFVSAAYADPNNNNSAKLRAAVTLEGVRAHQQALDSVLQGEQVEVDARARIERGEARVARARMDLDAADGHVRLRDDRVVGRRVRDLDDQLPGARRAPARVGRSSAAAGRE